MSRKFAVIGMQWAGSVLAEHLSALGHEVLGIDADKELIEELSGRLSGVRLVAADAQRTAVLRDLGIESFDGAAVTVEEDVQASVIMAITLKNFGVPLVVARAINPIHAQILEHVGVDRVTRPEEESGAYIARLMASRYLRRYLDLGGGEALAEVKVPDGWAGKSLSQLRLPQEQGLTVLLERAQSGGTLPDGDTVLHKGGTVVVWGKKEDLDGSDLLPDE